MEQSPVFGLCEGATARHAGVLDRWLAARLQAVIDPAAVRVELWDGTCSYAGTHSPIGSLVLRDRGTLIGLLVDPDVWFGEAYTAGDLEIRGDISVVIEALSRIALRA
jgi:cyclopropane-fatty-acyl-phospholipid synthase